MILVVTSVWIEHLARGVPALARALEEGEVATHPFVIGELACGNLRNREEILTLLGNLPKAPVATDAEVMAMVERRKLMGRGLGWVDVHLLAATLLDRGMKLWTSDRRLARVAANLS